MALIVGVAYLLVLCQLVTLNTHWGQAIVCSLFLFASLAWSLQLVVEGQMWCHMDVMSSPKSSAFPGRVPPDEREERVFSGSMRCFYFHGAVQGPDQELWRPAPSVVMTTGCEDNGVLCSSWPGGGDDDDADRRNSHVWCNKLNVIGGGQVRFCFLVVWENHEWWIKVRGDSLPLTRRLHLGLNGALIGPGHVKHWMNNDVCVLWTDSDVSLCFFFECFLFCDSLLLFQQRFMMWTSTKVTKTKPEMGLGPA